MGGRATESYGRHFIEADDIESVVRVLQSDFLTTGPVVPAFENALAKRIGVANAVVLSSGTAALHLAVLAADVGPGDVCIVPSMTFVATANAVRYAGAEVIFSDVNADTGLMEAGDFAKALKAASGRPVKAVLPVHLAGQTVNVREIAEIAQPAGIAIIEDASHAFGASTMSAHGQSHQVGSCEWSDMAIFSMHPVKTIAMGEGGAVTAKDDRFAKRVRRLRSHGITRVPEEFQRIEAAFDGGGTANPWYYEMSELGFNYRASDLHCALGLSQLGKLDDFLSVRRQLHIRYVESLAPLAPSVIPVPIVNGCNPAWHLMVVLVDFQGMGISRAEFSRFLLEKHIGTQVHYIPTHQQPYYANRYGAQRLPGAENYYRRCLSLPLHRGMTEGDVDYVVDAITEALSALAGVRTKHD